MLLCRFSGIVLNLTACCAHNFFHQRDNWRMHYLDLSLFSSFEWRVSHALSHHPYTNTAIDIELSALVPFWEFLPKPNKTLLQRYGSYVYDLVMSPVIPYVAHFTRIFEVFLGWTPLRLEYFTPYFELVVMAIISSSYSQAFK